MVDGTGGELSLYPKDAAFNDGGDLGKLHMCALGLNSHYFHIIGAGHQPNSRGLYTHYKDSH